MLVLEQWGGGAEEALTCFSRKILKLESPKMRFISVAFIKLLARVPGKQINLSSD